MTREESIKRLDEQTFKELAKESCGDCISRQAAINSLGECPMNWTDSEEEMTSERDWKDTVQMLKSLPSVMPTQKWIPVSEELPKEETDVLICNGNGDIELSRGSYSTEIKDGFIWYTSGWRFGKVIAWMPLPEPYKESE